MKTYRVEHGASNASHFGRRIHKNGNIRISIDEHRPNRPTTSFTKKQTLSISETYPTTEPKTKKKKVTHMRNAGNKYPQYFPFVSANGSSILATNSSTSPAVMVYFGDQYFTSMDAMPAMSVAEIPAGRNRTDDMRADQWYTAMNRGISWKNTTQKKNPASDFLSLAHPEPNIKMIRTHAPPEERDEPESN